MVFSPSDCRFSAFLPSTLACACVGVASWRLKLVDRGGVPEAVVQVLAKLLSADAVSPVRKSVSVCVRHCVLRLPTELDSHLL